MNGYWTAMQGVLKYRNSGVDSLYANTILLLTGQDTITTDSSPLANTLTEAGTITLDTTVSYGGLPTYRTLGAGRIDVSTPSFVRTQVGSGEFCFEAYIRIIKYPTATYPEAGLSAGFSGIQLTDSGGCSLTGFTYDGTAYGVALGTLSLDTWYHICVIKDDTDPTFAYLRGYLDGVYVASSSSFLKGDDLQGDGAGRLLGYHTTVPADSVHIAFAGVRYTKNTRRYLTASPSTPFTPDEPPFYAP